MRKYKSTKSTKVQKYKSTKVQKNELKVWTVLSTEENVLLRHHPLHEMSSFVPSAITQSFFELQTPDFARKFVCTILTNYAK